MIAVTRVTNGNLRCGVFEMLPFLRGRFWSIGATCSACCRPVRFILIFLAGEKKTLIFFYNCRIHRFFLARSHSMSILTNSWLVTWFCLMLKERNCHTCKRWFDYAMLINVMTSVAIQFTFAVLAQKFSSWRYLEMKICNPPWPLLLHQFFYVNTQRDESACMRNAIVNAVRDIMLNCSKEHSIIIIIVR